MIILHIDLVIRLFQRLCVRFYCNNKLHSITDISEYSYVSLNECNGGSSKKVPFGELILRLDSKIYQLYPNIMAFQPGGVSTYNCAVIFRCNFYIFQLYS